MALTDEERAEISRNNAKKSTGPRSPGGKARSSRKALKHGLRAESVALPNEGAEELRELTDEWLDYYQPASPGMRAQLDRAVLAQVQLRRCARFQSAKVAEKVREAQGHWDEGQEERVEKL